LAGQELLFPAAGEAGIGIADMVVAALVREGLDAAEARRRCWFVDSTGLVVGSRERLTPHKLGYAHEARFRGTHRGAATKSFISYVHTP
jgi:malate dehydrogenase (oxaloacetate-decarboxylating)(NADP+)